jgi:hypothetical protein
MFSDNNSSPFADPQGTGNPFTDESVRTATSASQSQRRDDFNPFLNDRTQAVVDVSSAAAAAAALPPLPPPYSSVTSAPQVNIPEELTNQQDQLERSATNLEREQSRTINYQHRQDNFPPLPACCPLKPCFHQDFDVDIPAQYRRTVKVMYYFWLAYVFMLFLNVIGALTTFIVASKYGDVGWTAITFGISIGYLLCLCPLSFICWYRPLYKAFRNDSSVNFFIFFFNFLVQLVVLIFACLGIGYFCSGWVGFLIGFQFLGYKLYGVGAFLVIIGGLFAAMAVVNFILISWVLKKYRGTGATFQKAQEEFSHGLRSATRSNISVRAGD